MYRVNYSLYGLVRHMLTKYGKSEGERLLWKQYGVKSLDKHKYQDIKTNKTITYKG